MGVKISSGTLNKIDKNIIVSNVLESASKDKANVQQIIGNGVVTNASPSYDIISQIGTNEKVYITSMILTGNSAIALATNFASAEIQIINSSSPLVVTKLFLNGNQSDNLTINLNMPIRMDSGQTLRLVYAGSTGASIEAYIYGYVETF